MGSSPKGRRPHIEFLKDARRKARVAANSHVYQTVSLWDESPRVSPTHNHVYIASV